MELDWRIATIIALLALSIYYVGLKYFFNKGHDWRIFIPLFFIISLVAMAYYFSTQKTIAGSSEAYMLAAGLLLLTGIFTATSIYAVNKGPVSVVAPLMAFSAPLVALLSSYIFPNEQLSTLQWLGVVLGLISIYLVSTG